MLLLLLLELEHVEPVVSHLGCFAFSPPRISEHSFEWIYNLAQINNLLGQWLIPPEIRRSIRAIWPFDP